MRRLALALSLAAALGGCGYRPLYGASERLAVVSAAPLVVDAALVTEVEAGVRAELARAGALRSGRGYPRVVVELLRADTASEGIAAQPGAVPLARGTRTGLVARAWLERGPSEPRERDTGDVRVTEVIEAARDARLEALRSDDAGLAAARRLGGRLARTILGQPQAPDEAL